MRPLLRTSGADQPRLEVATVAPFVGRGAVARKGAWGHLLAPANVLRLDLGAGHMGLYTCKRSLSQRFVEANSLSSLYWVYVKLKVKSKRRNLKTHIKHKQTRRQGVGLERRNK